MSPLFLLLAILPARDQTTPRAKERRPDRVLEWNEHALDAIRRDKTPPPVGSRNLAIVHAAVADTANTVYQTHRPYLVSLRATQDIDPDVAVASAAHAALVNLYPKQQARLDTLYQRYLETVPRGGPKSRAITLGRFVADKILADRADDVTPRHTSYRPSLNAGFWRPTPPGKAAALMPEWGETRPFGVKTTKAFRPTAPPDMTSRDYADEFIEVKELGGRRSTKRSAEQTIIALFWDDGPGTCTPPGHWNQIAREASLERGLTQAENARLFALLNLSLADAAVTCWGCKYRYKLWRPVTAIREADRDGNDVTRGEADWDSLLTTPPFPAYTSGHSTFSGAASAVLAKFFGSDDVAFTVGSDGYGGMRRAFRSFSEAAREAGKSRIYGGIHYECDNREGLALGRAVAEEVVRTRLRKDE